MEYVEILVIVIGLVWLFAAIVGQTKRKDMPGEPEGVSAPSPENMKKPNPAPAGDRIVFNIEGTARVQAKSRDSIAFVKAFNVDPNFVVDMARREGEGTFETFPSGLQDALKSLYENGCLRGQAIVDLVWNQGKLLASDAIYFVMVAPPQGNVHAVVFVDKANR